MRVSITIGCLLLSTFTRVLAQDASELTRRMLQHEQNIISAYLEYQKLYYEDKARRHELEAFENLLTVYINQVTEIYETLSLSQRGNETPRDITARSLLFKSLMFLEKAPLNREYFERACYEYYESLRLYEGSDFPPALYKDLPQMIRAGNRNYFRLIELVEEKGEELEQFGKVRISFRNFMVTANFDPNNVELLRLETEEQPSTKYTYRLAEDRIKRAFAEVFTKNREVETYVALPFGTYILRLRGDGRRQAYYTALTRLYVRPNQEQHYIMEPLADWIVLYENPSSKRPDFYKFRRSKINVDVAGIGSNLGVPTNGNGASKKDKKDKDERESISATHQKLVAEIVAEYLPSYEIKLMFDLNDSEIKDNAIEIISKSIVNYVESEQFYSRWNLWSACWEIAKETREVISPGSIIPIDLVKLIYRVINEL